MSQLNFIVAITLGLTSMMYQQTFASAPEAVPGEYVVKIRDDVKISTLKSSEISYVLGSYVKSILPDQNIVVIQRASIETEKSVIKTLEMNPDVEIVEPNYIYRINKTPNDPMYGNLWGLSNTGQADPKGQVGVAGVDISAEKAWDIETGSKNIVVAVIDTGIDYNNANLKDNVWTNEKELNGKPGVDDDGNGYVDDIHGYSFVSNTGDPKDDHGHGTHCSGTIGATGDDGSGIVGVAWKTRIMGVKFLDANGSGTLENALKAIDYASKNGAKIMSNSWGGGGFSETLKQAIERSNAAGALFVAAAGNESNDNDAEPTYPGSYDVANVLAVAAIDNQGKLASFSNWGKTKVHVAAPGVNVYSTGLNNEYKTWSGTSMATPHVSGLAVLLAAHEPKLKNTELKSRIVQTAKPLSSLKGKVKSGGLVNAYAALTNTVPAPDPNDPGNWSQKTLSVSSAHPYKEKAQESFEIKVDGAKQIALYFEKFDTENRYDTVTLYDAAGKELQVLSGNNNESYSNTIDGDYVKVVFKADDSVNGYGFDISKAAYR